MIRLDLSQLRGRLRKLATPRPGKRPWAVADLQPNRISAVLVSPGNGGQRPIVQQAGTLEFEDAAAAPDALAELAHTLRAGSQRWALLLPREDYRLSIMDAPEVPAAELTEGLRWQLANTLDFPVDDAAIDFMCIPASPGTQIRPPEIYAVAACGAVMNAQVALFRQAGLALQVIDIRETAQRNLAALLERPDELLAMVAFGESDVEITFSWQHELVMDRLIAEHVHIDDTPERRAASCERVQLQLQYSLDAVRTSYPFMQSARIVSAGAPANFVEPLKGMVSDPVEELVPDNLFDLSRVPQLKDPRVFMRYFHALGLALRDREAHA